MLHAGIDMHKKFSVATVVDDASEKIVSGRRLENSEEGKHALTWTRLSCTKHVSDRVRLALFVLAYNLGNFLRRFALPSEVSHWSLSSIRLKLI